jgi:replicative DNA helicase
MSPDRMPWDGTPPPENPDPLRLVADDEHGDPQLLVQKRGQFARAVEAMDEETEGYPTLGYADLVDVTGPLLPGQLWTLLARPENGKTTFCLNVMHKWLRASPAVGWAYFGTEEGTETQQRRFGAILTGLPPAEVVANQWAAIGGEAAKKEVHFALQDLHMGRYKHLAFFAEETRPKMRDVQRAAEDALRLDLPILVLDHFHRMAVPESRNEVATLAETVRRIKQLAVETGLVILMAAQARRTEGLARFKPPNPESGKGTGALEEESDVMLGLFRPIGRRNELGEYKPLTRGDEAAYERGELTNADVLVPHTMGVKVLKHRRNGDYSGQIVKLHCERGQLASLSYR